MLRMPAAAAALVLTPTLVLAAPRAQSRVGTVAAPGCALPAEHSRFVFRSGFWLNLHNFLHRGAKQRRGIQDEAPAALSIAVDDTQPARYLTPDERRIWDEALEFDVANAMTQGRADSIVERLNERLAGAADAGDLHDANIDPDVRQALLAAAPVYRAVWWPLHDRHNRAWITSLQALLGARETCLVRFLTRALVRDLPAQPVVVDASVYASWFGAYLTQNPLHITLSSTARANQASLGVETLLHEAGHTLTGPLDSALAETAARARRTLPPELMHLMLFYTAGHAVRSYLPGHVPYAQVFGIWSQNQNAERYYALLEREWRPYLEGRRGFDDAIARVVGALPRQPV